MSKGPLRFLILTTGVAATIWLLGLELFIAHIASLQEPNAVGLEPTDAIVALTGGSERVPAAIALLEAGKGKTLFISGVPPGLTLDRLLASVPKAQRECCVVLGHVADSTLGNASETEAWMQKEDYRSLRLVTANYHMPRSLLIFRAAMPDRAIIPYPVIPDGLHLTGWWLHPRSANLLVTEYNKYILACARRAIGS